MENGSVLVLDDERNIVTVLKAILEKRGFAVEGFTEPREALDALRKRRFDSCVTDLYMPDIDGMAFLEETKRLYPGLPVVMITAFGTVDSAVDAIKRGAFDYVTKPFEQSEIVSVVQKAVNTSRLKRLSLDRGEEEISAVGEISFSALLAGKGSAMRSLQETIRKVAPSPSPVLILGETGSGKEYLAEEIHQLSDRSFQPLIKVNCAAVSSMNLETELFGGAKPGRVELSHKGTLLLDEISELPLELQAKLSGFLDKGYYEHPLTGERRHADVRLLAASRKDLGREVKEARFSEELYYRLSVAPITLPALRDRREDMPDLVQFFLRRLGKKLNRPATGVAPSVMDTFRTVSWPGNLRQLEHVLERMLLLSDGGELKESDVLSELKNEIDQSAGQEGASFREIVRRQTQNLEKDLIEKALGDMEGNITRTAEHLGISRKGLQLKMKELGIRQA